MSYSTHPNDVLIPWGARWTNMFGTNVLVTNMFATVEA